MNDKSNCLDENLIIVFLGRRMVELREVNHKSQTDMATMLNVNKSTLSRVEGGDSSYKKTIQFAGEYCDAFGLSMEQKKLFLRATQAVVTDTSALLKKPQLIYELQKEYSIVIVPRIVIDELDHIKDNNINEKGKLALFSLSNIQDSNAIVMDYTGEEKHVNNDSKILDIAVKASERFNCLVDVITYDTGFAARLKGTNTNVRALYLEEYIATKQNIHDMEALHKIDEYYSDSYDDIETVLGITIPNEEDINTYLANGNTLIISAIRQKTVPTYKRKAKIKWLIEHGADVNKRDNGKYNFPPLSHVIQNNDKYPERDLDLFRFLLHECHANPNVGSKDPHDTGKIRQKNGGNMPLMVAAWHNKVEFVRELCLDERTSLNQQDGNGYTALIKAAGNGFLDCRNIILEAGADTKIVDRDGYTAKERYEEFLATELRMNRKYGKDEDENHSKIGMTGNRRAKYD